MIISIRVPTGRQKSNSTGSSTCLASLLQLEALVPSTSIKRWSAYFFYHFFHCHFIFYHCRHDHDHNHRHHGLGSGQIPLHKLARKIWSRCLCWLRPGCRWRGCSKIQVKLLTWRDFIFCLILTWRGLIFCLLQFQSEKLCEADKCEALPRHWSSCW